jgi:ATP-binding protein involved in chromosome partitioning
MSRQTQWLGLDYLIVDMPPGTGDIQLTLGQRLPVCGAVVVTTPQDIALIDAKKGVDMFSKVNIPILGIVENMSIHVCQTCGAEDHVFGAHGGQRMAQELGVPFLGALPLTRTIQSQADCGQPTVVSQPDSSEAHMYLRIAQSIAMEVADLCPNNSPPQN